MKMHISLAVLQFSETPSQLGTWASSQQQHRNLLVQTGISKRTSMLMISPKATWSQILQLKETLKKKSYSVSCESLVFSRAIPDRALEEA